MGVEPTKSQVLDLLALPVCVLGRQSRVQESHLTAGVMTPGRACAHPQQGVAGPGIEPGRRPYESRPGTCQACSRVAKGRVALPRPCGHRLLRTACLLIPPPGHVSSPWGNRTPLSAVRGRCPEPIDERTACVLQCVGQESNLHSRMAFALQAGGLTSAQPMRQRAVEELNLSSATPLVLRQRFCRPPWGAMLLGIYR